MEKNYYDILQVNKNASPEIIEKAYKVLAKKYHPDLQSEENKKHSEEVLKQINEAYDVLSDPIKRENYDKSLNQNTSDYDSQNLKEDFIRKQQEIEFQRKMQQVQYEQELENARQKAYYDAYIQDLKNRGYKIRYKKTFKDYIRLFITLIIITLVFFLLIQLPFVKNFFIKLYYDNEIIRNLIDCILNVIK